MRISLRHNTTFRLTVFAGLAFIAVGGAVLAFLYWGMLFVIDGQIGAALARECADMTAAYQRGGYERLRQTVGDRASPHPDALRIYLLIGADGTQTGNLGLWPSGAPSPGEAADIDLLHASTTARVRTLDFPDGSRLLVGRALTERDNFLAIVEQSIVSVLAANMLLGAAAGVALALYARRRLGQINATAQEVLDGNLAGRVTVGTGGDEYDHLAQNINAMLDRIQKLVATVRGVTENIAHDLRTPLNRLRGRLEVVLLAPRSPEEYQAVLKRAVTESETIVETFNGILKIARIKAGALDLPHAPVNLVEVVEELADLYQVFAEESGVIVEARVPLGSTAAGHGVFVSGDAHLISQAAANLLDNAIKYSPPGATVVISAAQSADGTSLTIADNGPGIAESERKIIRDRFVRLQSAAGKQGFGVGLSFASAVAEWHGAQLDLASNMPGLRATLRFPPAQNGSASRSGNAGVMLDKRGGN
ncbi:MAG: sensor histidine kinase [Rhodomicrobium sp.]